MPRRKDIDDLLSGWPFEPGEVMARSVKAADGREVLQMRVDMGVLQMEVANRPDGSRPEGADTLFDHLKSVELGEDEDWVLKPGTMRRGRSRVRSSPTTGESAGWHCGDFPRRCAMPIIRWRLWIS